MKVKDHVKRLFCKLRGGHLYTGRYLTTTRNEVNMTYTFSNRCLRCGKKFVNEIPIEDLLRHRK